MERVLEPAIRLAGKGFTLSRRQADRFNAFYDAFAKYPATKKYFTKGDSAARFEEGDVFRQKDLADVLRRIRKGGRDGFYKGETARLIAEQMEKGDGLITLEDLEAYEAVERPVVEARYRGYRVLSMPPPSSGGVALAQLLNAVEPYDIKEMGFGSSEPPSTSWPRPCAASTPTGPSTWATPTSTPSPSRELITKEYMQRRMGSFNPYRADTSETVEHGDPFAYESAETTHYSVVDSAGNAVSVTTTINGAYGSHVVVDGAGFFLNNEMDDFAAKPGVPNMFGLVGSEANAVEPEKRMLSSMTPTIVESPDGRLFMVIGTPGGSTIITTVFQVILNVIDHGMDIQEAVSVPRMHHQWLPDVLRAEEFALAKDATYNLELRGWDVESGGEWGRADGIVVSYETADVQVDPSGLEEVEAERTGRVYLGGADPRGEDVAVGY